MSYNPKRWLRALSRPLLGELALALSGTTDWTSERLSFGELYAGWRELPEAARMEIDRVLQGIDQMATPEAIQVAFEEGKAAGFDLLSPTSAFPCLADRALWIHLNHPTIWVRALRLVRVDDFERGRYWHRRLGMPPGEADLSPEAFRELRTALSGYYTGRQGRGARCHIEHMTRDTDGTNYWFCLLSDYADSCDMIDEDGNRVPRPGDRTFENIFAWRPGTNAMEMYARGGAAVIGTLAILFARTILHGDPEPEEDKKFPFQLDGLLCRVDFPTDMEDDVRLVQVKELDLDVFGRRDRGFTVRSKGVDDPGHILRVLEEDLNQKNLPKSLLRVSRAKLKLTFGEQGPARSMTFTVSTRSCNLKSLTEPLRVVGEKYLRKWKIDVA